MTQLQLPEPSEGQSIQPAPDGQILQDQQENNQPPNQELKAAVTPHFCNVQKQIARAWKWTNDNNGALQIVGAIVGSIAIPLFLFFIAEAFKQAENDRAEALRVQQAQQAKETRSQLAITNYFNQLSEILVQSDLQNNPDLQTFLAASTVMLLQNPDLEPEAKVQNFGEQKSQQASITEAAGVVCMRQRIDQKGPIIRHLIRAGLVQSKDSGLKNFQLKWQGNNLLSSSRTYTPSKPIISLNGASLNDTCLVKVELPGASLFEATLSGANLREANLIFADLRAVDLKGAILEDAWLIRANFGDTGEEPDCSKYDGCGPARFKSYLSGANLTGANLYMAILNNAVLQKTILSRANLTHAELKSVDLSGANLKDAKFREADLRGANLSGANLEGATFEEANLSDVNLSGADFGKPDDSLPPNVNKGASEINRPSNLIPSVADFRQAKGLTKEQVMQAKNWQHALYDKELRQQLGLPSN